MDPIKRKEITEKTVLILPLFLAFIWMGYLVIGVQNPGIGMKLAPSRLDNLINALFAFIIIYAIVLGFIFYKMKKSLKVAEKKKPAKKKK